MLEQEPAPGTRRIARILLGIGCLSGLGIYLMTPIGSPDQVMLASDVYRFAATRMLEGDPIYGVAPADRPGYFYLYPPIVTLVFLPHAVVGTGIGAFALQTLLNLGAAVGTALLVDRLVVSRGIGTTRGDRGLLIAFFVLSSYSAIQFINGQINLWLGFAFAVAFCAIDRQRPGLAGFAFGIAALFKVFPAIMGVWLLRLRAWRAVIAAVLTGLCGLVLGIILFGPELTVSYLTDVLIARFEGSTYHARPSADAHVDGIHRQLAAVWPGGTPWHTPVALAVLGGTLVMALYRVDTARNRDLAGLATILAVLLFLPLQPLYFPLVAVPLVPVLYDLPSGWVRWVFVAGTLGTMTHLNQPSVDLLLGMSPLPGLVVDSLRAMSAAVFRVILPPTLGMWLLLAGCLGLRFQTGDSG